MIRKILLPVLAAVGIVFAVYTVVTGNRQRPAAPPLTLPAQTPYTHSVAGAGIVEASTENIAVGTLVSGVVTDIYVDIGDEVKKGDELFKLDDRDLRAQLAVKRAAAKSVAAKIATENAALADTRNQLETWQSVTDTRAVTKEEIDRKRFAVQIQEARVAQAQADAQSAEAEVRATETEIDRRLVRAPVDGQVMQIKVRLGEFAQSGVLQTPLMLVGNTRTLHVRVDVDENDAWRIRPDSRATAYVRGNRDLKTEMKFVRIEPYVVPKRSLTGDSTERVDTRVLQILYSFPRENLKVYVGQQMDVSIEAAPVSASTQAAVEDRS